MGIEDIREEYLNRSNLYTDLDQLEKSVQAEFEQYMNQVRSFPFNEDIEHPDDSECAVQTENTQESQYEELEGDSADQVLEHIDTDVSSWQEYFDNNVVERSNMEMNRNSNLSVIPQTQGNDLSEQNAHNRSMSPGEYFGARSLPLDSIDRVWKQPSIDVDQHDSVIEDQHSYVSLLFFESLFYCYPRLNTFLLVIQYESRQKGKIIIEDHHSFSLTLYYRKT